MKENNLSETNNSDNNVAPIQENNQTVNQQPAPPIQENQNQVETSNPVTETNQENGYNTMFLAPILNL